MTQCRMCSQRLTRPGKLCRECERELDRARFAGVSHDDMAALAPIIDASRIAASTSDGGRLARMRQRGSVIAMAFTIGLVGAAGLHLAQRSTASVTPRSVMLDRDAGHERVRTWVSTSASAPPNATPSSPDAPASRIAATSSPDAPAPGSFATTSASTEHALHDASVRRATLQVKSASAREPEHRLRDGSGGQTASTMRAAGSETVAAVSAPAGETRPAYDRVLAYSDEMGRCGEETFFARIACEQRARSRYCDGASAQLPQCAGEFPRDHGQ